MYVLRPWHVLSAKTPAGRVCSFPSSELKPETPRKWSGQSHSSQAAELELQPKKSKFSASACKSYAAVRLHPSHSFP